MSMMVRYDYDYLVMRIMVKIYMSIIGNSVILRLVLLSCYFMLGYFFIIVCKCRNKEEI